MDRLQRRRSAASSASCASGQPARRAASSWSCNFTPVPRHELPRRRAAGGYWQELLNSDAREYGAAAWATAAASTADLRAWSALDVDGDPAPAGGGVLAQRALKMANQAE